MGYYCKAPLLTVENRWLIDQIIYCDLKSISLVWGTISASSHFPHAGRFEQAFVNSFLSENGANSSMYYWIGLVDMEREGEYSWLPHNGSSLPLTFTNWNKHQPGSQLLFSFSLLMMEDTQWMYWVRGVHVNLFLNYFIFSLNILVSASGCVAMSGGPALGHWEVKDCKSHKALSVCKQSISSYQDVQLPEHHIDAYAPCPPGWESNAGLLDCFKVGSWIFFCSTNWSIGYRCSHVGFVLVCFVLGTA